MQSEKKEILATAVGRRKEAVAQVQLVRGTGEFQINNKPASLYLNNNSCSWLALKEPFQVFENENSQVNSENVINENAATFKEIGTITIGATGAAEISAYDEVSKKLFTVNNSGTNKIDVIDLSNPSTPVLLASIDLVT